jgi:propionate CoA-transferase
MSLLLKIQRILQLLHFRVTWKQRDTAYVPAGTGNPQFMSAREAVSLIRDGECVMSSGIASNARCSIFYWALRESSEQNGHPRELTWVANAGSGGRGKAPGTIEELDPPGLLTRFVGGHLETYHKLLEACARGRIEMHTMGQGTLAYLVEAQSRGEDSILTEVGVGTFLDPRVGNGSRVVGGKGENLIEVEGDLLRYRLPLIDVAMFTAPYADVEGNIYVENIATLTESRESALAARKNGGRVLVSVSEIKPKRPDRIFMTADRVDAIVVNPRNEQTGGVLQTKYWTVFTEGANEDLDQSLDVVRFINEFLKITPVRTDIDLATARAAADLFTTVSRPGAEVNIGVGLPEQVCKLIYEGGLYRDVTFGTESGAHGGMPLSGIYFGAALNPKKLMSSAEIFHLWERDLDTTILGVLEVDGQGNVNVSRSGEALERYVGPGGFTNLVHYAKNIIFVGSWMTGGRIEVKGGRVRIAKPGKHKFRERVSEITMSGPMALKRKKKVFYVTNVGVFRLTERGVELFRVMPGIDIDRDIIDPCPMKIALPGDGRVETIDASIVTGDGFELRWPTAG